MISSHSCYWWRDTFSCYFDDVCCNWLLHRTRECLLPNSDNGIMKIWKEMQNNFCGMPSYVPRDMFRLRSQLPSTSVIYLYPYSTQVSSCSQDVYDCPCREIQVLRILPMMYFFYSSLWSFNHPYFFCLFVHSFLSWLCKLLVHISLTK